VAELLAKQIPTARVVNFWEAHLSPAVISQSPDESKEVAKKISKLGADIVIGPTAD
jgi:hypothetical protein